MESCTRCANLDLIEQRLQHEIPSAALLSLSSIFGSARRLLLLGGPVRARTISAAYFTQSFVANWMILRL